MEKEIAIGAAVNRLEGREKVTGSAKYAAEYQAEGLLYGYVINSRVTNRKMKSSKISARGDI